MPAAERLPCGQLAAAHRARVGDPADRGVRQSAGGDDGRKAMARRVRVRRRSLLLICAALVIAVVCPPVAGQDSGDYERLLDRYKAGFADQAVAALSRWPRGNVNAAVRIVRQIAEVGPGAASRFRAAALLHTELAAAVLNTDRNLSDFHVGLAR